jgi:hypothetical protein
MCLEIRTVVGVTGSHAARLCSGGVAGRKSVSRAVVVEEDRKGRGECGAGRRCGAPIGRCTGD